jgi:hypothetical protein
VGGRAFLAALHEPPNREAPDGRRQTQTGRIPSRREQTLACLVFAPIDWAALDAGHVKIATLAVSLYDAILI